MIIVLLGKEPHAINILEDSKFIVIKASDPAILKNDKERF